MMKGKKYLVTGGAGFLGSHLCDRLIAEGAGVLCLDNFFTGSTDNVSHLLNEPRFDMVRHDVISPFYTKVDGIFNLACPASPIHYQYDPIKTVKTSVMGAINMLGMAKDLRIPILQTSTSEVYGDPLIHPQPESYWGNVNPIGPRACYDEGKRAAETLFFSYRQQYNMPIKVIRIFNTYGPRMRPDDGRVVSNFIFNAIKGKNLVIYGDGLQTRSFCYVDDLIEGMVRMILTPNDVTGPINLGNPGEFTIRELAEKILSMTRSGSSIEFRPAMQDDPKQRQPDISLAKSTLGWQPVVPLEEGLRKTIRYFQSQIENSAQ